MSIFQVVTGCFRKIYRDILFFLEKNERYSFSQSFILMPQRKPADSKVTNSHSNLPGQLPAAADLSFMGLMFYNHLYTKQVIEKAFWVLFNNYFGNMDSYPHFIRLVYYKHFIFV